MVRRADRPWKLAPYPTDVGTAITGASARPAITVPRAPSIPATAIMQFALQIRSLWLNSLWIPATPTS